MADGLLRWRRPLLIGVGIWLLSFPLLTWHPAAASHPVHVAPMAAWDAEADDHRLVRELAPLLRSIRLGRPHRRSRLPLRPLPSGRIP